ncbi:MAG: HAD family hydrolase [Clostridia bacterium]|nr:HAD family hydrolase [Clostridia bacterium]
MNPTGKPLSQLQKQHDFLVCIDSDGTVFDVMEIKHKECFCPAFINNFGLQAVAKYARECWDFVNLYSVDRGCNRFIGPLKAIALLAERPEVNKRGFAIPDLSSLHQWVSEETRLGNPALKDAIAKTQDPWLQKALAYSLDVNEAVDKIVHDIPPFPGVRESLAKSAAQADIVVISAAAQATITREWTEHGLYGHLSALAGQEVGNKTVQIQQAIEGRYDKDKVIMMGDALGDLESAKANGVLFYPILPGQEDKSWQRFHDEALAKFLDGSYAGSYEASLIETFKEYLPITPPWAQN